MSMTSELIDRLRKNVNWLDEEDNDEREIRKSMLEAADTIRLLSKKLCASQMERSSQYYNGGWIPCEDRVPVTDDYVFAWNGQPIVAYYDGEWYSNDGNFDEDISPITYWMPLPNKPKEDE